MKMAVVVVAVEIFLLKKMMELYPHCIVVGDDVAVGWKSMSLMLMRIMVQMILEKKK